MVIPVVVLCRLYCISLSHPLSLYRVIGAIRLVYTRNATTFLQARLASAEF